MIIIPVPIWVFIMLILLSIIGVAAIIWFIVSVVVYIRDYKDSL